MAIPLIFAEDPTTKRLASYFEEIYAHFVESGVPEECLPSPWHILRHVTKAIDQDLLQDWLESYIRIEAELVEDDEEGALLEGPLPRPRRPRPSYLSVLDPEDGDPEE